MCAKPRRRYQSKIALHGSNFLIELIMSMRNCIQRHASMKKTTSNTSSIRWLVGCCHAYVFYYIHIYFHMLHYLVPLKPNLYTSLLCCTYHCFDKICFCFVLFSSANHVPLPLHVFHGMYFIAKYSTLLQKKL